MLQLVLRIIVISAALFLFIWTWIDKRKIKVLLESINNGKDNLKEIIDDAEEMINELNRFSEHIVTRMDIKNTEIWRSMKKLDEKVEQSSRRVRQIKMESDRIQSDIKGTLAKTRLAETGIQEENPTQKNKDTQRKIIPMSGRYREVLNLAANGYSDTEIAKKLSMGKGEIKLVLELTNNKTS